MLVQKKHVTASLVLAATTFFSISGCAGYPSKTETIYQDHLLNAIDAVDEIREEYDRCNSQIIDVHLHLAAWFDSAAALLAEMDESYISIALLLAVYGPVASPFGGDTNEVVESIVNGSSGRIFGLASLNTTTTASDDWDNQRGAELQRLTTFLNKKPGFVGAKLAPPHTCLPLDSTIMRDIIHTVSVSSSPVAFIHIGTTPFCGPMGAVILGRQGCCSPEYVDPTHLEAIIQEYTNVTFVLVHAGADFLPPTDEYYYHLENVEKSVNLADAYDHVYLEISAFLRQDENNSNMTDVYSGGTTILAKIAHAGLARKTIYGSDVNQAPAAMGPYLWTAVRKMKEAGFQDEERCMILAENAMTVFGLKKTAGSGGGQAETPVEDDESSTNTTDNTTSLPHSTNDNLDNDEIHVNILSSSISLVSSTNLSLLAMVALAFAISL